MPKNKLQSIKTEGDRERQKKKKKKKKKWLLHNSPIWKKR